MKRRNVLFFADRLPPLIGGMEMHAQAFIDTFTQHPRYPLAAIVTKNEAGDDFLIFNEEKRKIDLDHLHEKIKPDLIFFNSGRWIEELSQIRTMFPQAIFVYRTGGNEILKAPLKKVILSHSLRQNYWAKTLNQTIDLLITNSAFTEKRLRDVGLACPFARCVGGVNLSAFKSEVSQPAKFTIFSAARFVPYKNHALLLSVMRELASRGHSFRVRLAGDGPLLELAKQQVLQNNLATVVEFLGALNNRDVCKEIAFANIYAQLSSDEVTEVPGGSYIHSEGMGRSILEALTAGTYVVAGRSGALSEIVTPDRGELVDLADSEKIVELFENLLRHPPTRRAFSDTFCWNRIFQRYEEEWEKLL